MVAAISSALGGIREATKGIAIAANNIANVNTEGFVRQTPPSGAPATESGPDLAVDLVGLIVSRTMLKANLVTIQTVQATYQDILKLGSR